MAAGAAQPAPGGEVAVNPTPTGPSQGAENESAYSELASGFLQSVPEQQRALLEPHLKKWDAGVTKKFQEIHSQYAPYKELGADPEILAQAWQLYQVLDQNPQQIYDILKQEFEGQATAGGETAPGTPATQQMGDEGFELPPALASRLEQMENVISQLGQLYLADKKQTSEASEQAQFDQYLNELREQYGDFDEEYVTLKISQGMEGEDAIKAWNQMLESKGVTANGGVNQTPAPTVLGGGGALPSEEMDVTKLDSKSTKNLVAGLLEQTAREGG